jgi:hypothetical protein
MTSRTRVHVLSARTPKAFNSAYPLRAFRRGIRAKGLDVRLFFANEASLVDCDVLCVMSEHWKGSNGNGAQRLDQIKRYRDAVSTLVWLDTSDSSGTTSFEVLPFVDLYAKSQLLRDRSKYTASFYGMRCYTDFYHRREQVTDTRETQRQPAEATELHKLALSWNLGLGSYVQRSREITSRIGKLRFYWPYASYSWKETRPDSSPRAVDISYRGRLDYNRETLTYQRREAYRRVLEFAKGTGCNIAHAGRLPYREYREEVRRSKLVLSPFGFGEINAGRDFECFTDGAALVKPDMTHLVTWPDFFEAGVTYAPHAWDFSDFEMTLERLLTRPDERLAIARAGQTRYLQSLSDEGETAFADHFQQLLERARGGRVH